MNRFTLLSTGFNSIVGKTKLVVTGSVDSHDALFCIRRSSPDAIVRSKPRMRYLRTEFF